MGAAFGRLGVYRLFPCFGFCCRVGRPTMLRMLSNVFVSLGRNTIDATRAFGRSDATVVALVLSIVVVIKVLAAKILQGEFVLTPSKNTTWAQSTPFIEAIMKLGRSTRLSLSLSRIAFVVFWVTYCATVTMTQAAPRCLHCKDNILPAHDAAACPLCTTVAGNATALAATSTAVLIISKILPRTCTLRTSRKKTIEYV